jgi:hypothetical protein
LKKPVKIRASGTGIENFFERKQNRRGEEVGRRPGPVGPVGSRGNVKQKEFFVQKPTSCKAAPYLLLPHSYFLAKCL